MDKGMRGEVSPFNLVSILGSPGNHFSIRMVFKGVGPSGIGAMRVADAQTGWEIARMGPAQ
jgi:hypothetical protein